ncbi:multidrug transporter MatE [Acidobacteria bacterium Mor1]|nr:multidrug transporter MatE [Acidobacteria bacterium Mor1]
MGWGQAIRESLAGKQFDFTKLDLKKAILLLAIPMVIEMTMESVFAVFDVFFVARLGADAVAAVGLTEAVLTLIYAVAIGLAMATTAMVARRIGEQDNEGAVRAATQAIALGIMLSAAVGIPAAIFGDEILRLMDAEESTIAIGSGYTSILLGTNAVIFLLFLNNAIFRGAGDPVIAMRSLMLANGINIVLDPCLIFGLGPFPEMGVTGAAVATTIGRGTGVLYQFWALRQGSARVRLIGPAFRLHLQTMLRLVRVSLGGIGQFLIATASWVVLMKIMARFGAEALAGYTIAIRIIIFVLMPSWGFSNAAATLVGQNLGAKQPERAEKSVWLTGAYNMGFLALVTVIFVIFAPQLVGIFTDDPAIQTVGAEALRVISYGYVFYAWGMVVVQAFNGAGDTMTPTWINLFTFWTFQIPLAWFLATRAGFESAGVFWAVVLAESVLTVVSILVFRRGAWKLRTV